MGIHPKIMEGGGQGYTKPDACPGTLQAGHLYPAVPSVKAAHCAAEGHFRGLAIQNFLDMVGFYMLVRGYHEVFGHQGPQNWAH